MGDIKVLKVFCCLILFSSTCVVRVHADNYEMEPPESNEDEIFSLSLSPSTDDGILMTTGNLANQSTDNLRLLVTTYLEEFTSLTTPEEEFTPLTTPDNKFTPSVPFNWTSESFSSPPPSQDLNSLLVTGQVQTTKNIFINYGIQGNVTCKCGKLVSETILKMKPSEELYFKIQTLMLMPSERERVEHLPSLPYYAVEDCKFKQECEFLFYRCYENCHAGEWFCCKTEKFDFTIREKSHQRKWKVLPNPRINQTAGRSIRAAQSRLFPLNQKTMVPTVNNWYVTCTCDGYSLSTILKTEVAKKLREKLQNVSPPPVVSYFEAPHHPDYAVKDCQEEQKCDLVFVICLQKCESDKMRCCRERRWEFLTYREHNQKAERSMRGPQYDIPDDSLLFPRHLHYKNNTSGPIGIKWNVTCTCDGRALSTTLKTEVAEKIYEKLKNGSPHPVVSYVEAPHDPDYAVENCEEEQKCDLVYAICLKRCETEEGICCQKRRYAFSTYRRDNQKVERSIRSHQSDTLGDSLLFPLDVPPMNGINGPTLTDWYVTCTCGGRAVSTILETEVAEKIYEQLKKIETPQNPDYAVKYCEEVQKCDLVHAICLEICESEEETLCCKERRWEFSTYPSDNQKPGSSIKGPQSHSFDDSLLFPLEVDLTKNTNVPTVVYWCVICTCDGRTSITPLKPEIAETLYGKLENRSPVPVVSYVAAPYDPDYAVENCGKEQSCYLIYRICLKICASEEKAICCRERSFAFSTYRRDNQRLLLIKKPERFLHH